MFAHNSYAIGGDSIWLKKTKRGVDISCPTNFEYFESIIGYSCKSNDAVFLVIIDYDDLYVEEEFFDEKEVMKNAIILAKTGDEEVKIIEKKSSKWLGQITANVKFEQSYDKGIARVIIFNDGTIISIYAKSEDNTFRTVEQFLSKQIKILDPNQVKELERIQDEYTKKAEELASKKAAEEYKKKLEKQKKLEAEKRDLLERKRIEEEKKKAEEAKIRAEKEEKEAKIKAEKAKKQAEDQKKKVKENLIAYGVRISDLGKKLDSMWKNPNSGRYVDDIYSLQEDLRAIKSKYTKFSNEKTFTAMLEVRNLIYAFEFNIKQLEIKQIGEMRNYLLTEERKNQQDSTVPKNATQVGKIIKAEIVCGTTKFSYGYHSNEVKLKIVDEHGQPISRAFVVLYNSLGASLEKTRSDENGNAIVIIINERDYTIDFIKKHQFKIKIEKPGMETLTQVLTCSE